MQPFTGQAGDISIIYRLESEHQQLMPSQEQVQCQVQEDVLERSRQGMAQVCH